MAKANENTNEPTVTREEYNALLEKLEALMKASENKSANKTVVADEESAKKWETMVPVKVVSGHAGHKDDFFVGVNGRRYLIQVGKTVTVPLPVYEVIASSLEQDEKTEILIAEQSGSAKIL